MGLGTVTWSGVEFRGLSGLGFRVRVEGKAMEAPPLIRAQAREGRGLLAHTASPE